jgi:hypothetical protein
MSAKFDFVNCDRYRQACEQGATFTRQIRIRDQCTGVYRDFTGYTAKMMVKTAVGGTTIIEFNTTPATGKGTITISGDTITITATSTITDAKSAGNYYFDLEITAPAPASTVERILEGRFQITGSITV